MKTITRCRRADERSQRGNEWIVGQQPADAERVRALALHTNAVHALRNDDRGYRDEAVQETECVAER